MLRTTTAFAALIALAAGSANAADLRMSWWGGDSRHTATQEALKHFNPDGGSIVNIGSLASVLTPPTGVVYNATKAAVDAITRTLAKELGPRKIRVNAINPGMVITEGVITGGFHESDFRTMLESQTPLGRVGQTDDIAPAAVFFASDDSKWITGETLVIAGGLR